MKGLHCTALSLLSIFAAAPIFSFFSTANDNEPQTPPSIMETCVVQSQSCKRVGYEFFGQFLYLQPNGSDLYYAVEAFPFDEDIAVPPISPNWKVFEIDPDYAPGFELGFKTLFPETNSQITLDWERLYTHDHESMDVAASNDMVGPNFDIGPNSSVYKEAKGKASFQFDEADLLFGKKVCVFDRLSLNLQAGASFARIKQRLTSKFTNESAGTERIITSPSTFIGAGTKFGVCFDLQICKNFSFTGSTALSLLMGQLKNSTTFKSFSPSLANLDIPQPNTQRTKVPNRSQLIPGFEEKLGFSYCIKFKNCTRLLFGVGYQFQIFLNAVQTFDMTAPQVLPSLTPAPTVQDGVYAVGFERTLSNFILSGPYFSASIDF